MPYLFSDKMEESEKQNLAKKIMNDFIVLYKSRNEDDNPTDEEASVGLI